MQLELRPSITVIPPPAIDLGLPKTRIRGSATAAGTRTWSEPNVSRSPHQGWGVRSTTIASGLRCFLSVDSAKDWDPYKPQSWNMYAYVRNNPMNTADPTGKWGWSDFKEWVRDTREDVSNWWHEKWHKDIPPPPDQYGGVEALKAADLSPADAQQMGNPQANWANARAEAGAVVSDEATEEVMSWGVGKAIGVAGVVVFGHGARHLIGTALEKEAVEGAIEKEIEFVSKEASQTGSFWGRVTVNGKVIEYRAFTLPDGTINVGTYYTKP